MVDYSRSYSTGRGLRPVRGPSFPCREAGLVRLADRRFPAGLGARPHSNRTGGEGRVWIGTDEVTDVHRLMHERVTVYADVSGGDSIP